MLCIYDSSFLILQYLFFLVSSYLSSFTSSSSFLHASRTRFACRPSRYFWEVVVALRKALILSLSVIGSANTGLAWQTHLAMLVLIGAIVAHLIGDPYMKKWQVLDRFETVGLLVCWVLMWSGIVFYLEDSMEHLRTFTTMFLVFINSVYTLVTLVVLLRQKFAERPSLVKLVIEKCSIPAAVIACFYQIGKLLPVIDVTDDGGKERWEARIHKSATDWVTNPNSNSRNGGKSDTSVAVALEMSVLNESTSSDNAVHMAEGKDSEEVDQEEDLPEGWREQIDSASGKTYYWNKISGKTAWKRPTKKLAPMLHVEHLEGEHRRIRTIDGDFF